MRLFFKTLLHSLRADKWFKGGKRLRNCEAKVAALSRFLEFDLCNVTKDHIIMQLQGRHISQRQWSTREIKRRVMNHCEVKEAAQLCLDLQ